MPKVSTQSVHARGGDFIKLLRLMGHTSAVVTENYLRAFQVRDARRDHRPIFDNLSPPTKMLMCTQDAKFRSKTAPKE